MLHYPSNTRAILRRREFGGYDLSVRSACIQTTPDRILAETSVAGLSTAMEFTPPFSSQMNPVITIGSGTYVIPDSITCAIPPLQTQLSSELQGELPSTPKAIFESAISTACSI